MLIRQLGILLAFNLLIKAETSIDACPFTTVDNIQYNLPLMMTPIFRKKKLLKKIKLR